LGGDAFACFFFLSLLPTAAALVLGRGRGGYDGPYRQVQPTTNHDQRRT
jgi:hypothetical protein